MKKIALIALLTGAVAGSTFAAVHTVNPSALAFGPHAFASHDPSDTVNVQLGVTGLQSYDVEIFVDRQGYMQQSPTGVNVKNCGPITHINAGSSAICTINSNNPSVTFSSDSTDPNKLAWGTFQLN